MGTNIIISIVAGAILLIVSFTLWPVLNGATNQLYSFFQDSCVSPSDDHFTKGYFGVNTSALPASLGNNSFYVNQRVHGGSGVNIEDNGGVCRVPFPSLTVSPMRVMWPNTNASTTPGWEQAGATQTLPAHPIYNEEGEEIGTQSLEYWLYVQIDTGANNIERCGVGPVIPAGTLPPPPPVSVAAAGGTTSLNILTKCGNAVLSWQLPRTFDLDSTYRWVQVAGVLERFSGINNLLLTILPVISIAGALAISAINLYRSATGTRNIGQSITISVVTLISIVVLMTIAAPIMGSIVMANQVVESGQYSVNSAFGNILGLLFGMLPVVFIAGLLAIVGDQALRAFDNR